MKRILLTGVNGFVGSSLLPLLLDAGHYVYGCVRSADKLSSVIRNHPHFEVLEIDFLAPLPEKLPDKIDVAFYLIHSMGRSTTHFQEDEAKQAQQFINLMLRTGGEQAIYLSGIAPEDDLSAHLESRKNVADLLCNAPFATTVLRAAIVVGKGGSSMQIMCDLVQKMPLMIAPKSLENDCQPIALSSVLHYLLGVMGNPLSYNKTFDIGGLDVLTYKEMLYTIAKIKGLKRKIITVPWISPRFEAHWFYFITSAPYRVAVNLANSMRNRVVCQENSIDQIVQVKRMTFEKAARIALGEY